MKKELSKRYLLVPSICLIMGIILIWGCSDVSDTAGETPTRAESIPADAVKITPEMDIYPPITHSLDWTQPTTMNGPINTAGAEDAPVITPDGNTFIFFFTPDVSILPEDQLLDHVTGVWWCTKNDSVWEEPQRALLCDDDELALDGPFCIEGNKLWFCSARVGNYRELDIYTAELNVGNWDNWINAGHLLNVDYLVGELYTTADGNTMFYDSKMDNGYGGKDIWKITKVDGEWTEPVNLGAMINTDSDEGWLYVTADGNELWFTRWSELGYMGPAIFRSIKSQDGSWNEPEEIISNFAGDPALDAEGNIYFTHHYFSADAEMIEADIYVAYRR